MSRFSGPQGIVTNGLVLNLDAGDPDSYTRSQPPYVEVLVVAGGGSGGSSAPANGGGGGGGAGGVIYNSAYQLTSAAAVTVTVGAGGAGQTTNNVQGNDGSNSVFGALTAIGGGGGGGAGVNTTGRNGGSGGGAGYAGYYNNFNSGTGTTGQGFRGGFVLANNNGAAGGGAGGEGGNTFDSRPEPGYPAGGGGDGGPGVYYSISGTSTLYSTGGNGSLNGSNTIVSGSGTFGAYGGSSFSNTAASGIVIVRYPGLPAATGGTITYLNGYTIHTFTSSGTFTPYLWNDVTGNNRNATLNGTVTASMQTNGGILSVYNPSGTSQPDFFNFSPGSTSGYNPLNYANCSVTVAFRWNATNDYWERVFDFGRGGNNTGVGLNALIFTRYSTSSDLYIITHGGLSNIGVKIGELNIGTWQIYTITWNAGSQIYYKNGSVYTSTTSAYSLADYFGATRTDEQYYLGKSNWNDGGSRISYGAFIIHNRVLSATEVTQMYNALRFRYGL